MINQDVPIEPFGGILQQLEKVTDVGELGSDIEAGFFNAWRMVHASAPVPVMQHQFETSRKWAFDFAWPDQMLAVEIEGGTGSGGRHVRFHGFRNDCDKYNRATQLGWRVIRFTSEHIKKQPVQSVGLVFDILSRSGKA